MKKCKITGPHIIINNKRLVNLCSNDYLGIPPTKIMTRQMQSSSRLVSGNDKTFDDLERILARHKTKQSSLVYPTGYMANIGTIPTLAGKGDLILSDSLNHASIIESCKMSGAKVEIFGHNNTEELASKLKQKAKSKFVITEGIFSMDGDLSKLDQITEISQKSNAITILDDAHGDFAIGNDGKGTADYFGVSKNIDVYISSLSKGLGSFGGYVAAEKSVIDYCINKARAFIYTSALPSMLIEYSLKRMKMKRERYRKKLQRNTKKISNGLKQIGYDIKSPSHIIPIIIGNEKTTLDFGKYVFKNGMFAQPIRYPTVPKNQARLRISVTGWLSDAEIDLALSVFEKASKKFKISSV